MDKIGHPDIIEHLCLWCPRGSNAVTQDIIELTPESLVQNVEVEVRLIWIPSTNRE